MKYFLLRVYYHIPMGKIPVSFRRTSEHIIKAETKDEALQIREKYNIAHSLQKNTVSKVLCVEMDLNNHRHTWRIENRRRGLFGSIWYEENGELKTEKELI